MIGSDQKQTPENWNPFTEICGKTYQYVDGQHRIAYAENAVHWYTIDGAGGAFNIHALTRSCAYASETESGSIEYFDRMWSMWMTYDANDNWYLGTGTPPKNQVDLWSMATHEFGHATGWNGPGDDGYGHFTQATPPDQDDLEMVCPALPEDVSQQTMCNLIFDGTTRFRTLGKHDIHTTASGYNDALYCPLCRPTVLVPPDSSDMDNAEEAPPPDLSLYLPPQWILVT